MTYNKRIGCKNCNYTGKVIRVISQGMVKREKNEKTKIDWSKRVPIKKGEELKIKVPCSCMPKITIPKGNK